MTECPICDEAKSLEVFSTANVQVLAHPSPSTPGHVLVTPKKHFAIFEAVPDDIVGELFSVANTVSTKLFDGLGAQGTNILLQNGLPAGQSEPHVVLHVIPRKQGDGLDFTWKPKVIDEAKLNDLEKLLKDGLAVVEAKPKEEQLEDTEDWELKHLERIP